MGAMEISLPSEIEARLREVAAECGRAAGDLIEDALGAYLDELDRMREMLTARDEELDSGSAKAIDGEEAFALLMQRTDAQRRKRTA